jgi:hypothetical protein
VGDSGFKVSPEALDNFQSNLKTLISLIQTDMTQPMSDANSADFGQECLNFSGARDLSNNWAVEYNGFSGNYTALTNELNALYKAIGTISQEYKDAGYQDVVSIGDVDAAYSDASASPPAAS